MASPGGEAPAVPSAPADYSSQEPPRRTTCSHPQPISSHAARRRRRHGGTALPVTDAPLGLSAAAPRLPQPTSGERRAGPRSGVSSDDLSASPPPPPTTSVPRRTPAVTGARPRRRYLRARLAAAREPSGRGSRGAACRCRLPVPAAPLPAFPGGKWRAPGGGRVPVVPRAGRAAEVRGAAAAILRRAAGSGPTGPGEARWGRGAAFPPHSGFIHRPRPRCERDGEKLPSPGSRRPPSNAR